MPAPKALPDGITEPPVYKLTTPAFHDGQKMVFEASWIGIPVATARVELHRKGKDPGPWTAEAWVETNKFADVLFKMRDYLAEDLDQKSLTSRKMYIRQSENKRLNDFMLISSIMGVCHPGQTQSQGRAGQALHLHQSMGTAIGGDAGPVAADDAGVALCSRCVHRHTRYIFSISRCWIG